MMTEEKKKLSPKAKWGIAYLVYALLCIPACYGASALQQAMWHRAAETFKHFPYIWVSAAAFAVLGLLWAAEGLLAAKVRKIVMLPVRAAVIFLLCVMVFGGLLGIGMIGHVYAGLSGNINVIALVIGWLVIDTAAKAFRRA